ncbi:MAG: hypothetical protein JWM78_3545 [Verrucomicrobiaceae bacterium]|nr:hypothetical protein [Verrucomicrobiaceae bacterium]
MLFCQLQPNASRDEFSCPVCSDKYGERLKIRVTAPPIDGKANAHLIKFLAAQFGVAKQAVRIVSGDGARQKTVRIENPQQLPVALAIAAAPAQLCK